MRLLHRSRRGIRAREPGSRNGGPPTGGERIRRIAAHGDEHRPEWLDGSDLAGFPEEAAETLAEGNISGWRVDYLKAGIEERVAAVLSLL